MVSTHVLAVKHHFDARTSRVCHWGPLSKIDERHTPICGGPDDKDNPHCQTADGHIDLGLSTLEVHCPYNKCDSILTAIYDNKLNLQQKIDPVTVDLGHLRVDQGILSDRVTEAESQLFALQLDIKELKTYITDLQERIRFLQHHAEYAQWHYNLRVVRQSKLRAKTSHHSLKIDLAHLMMFPSFSH
ncbi:hypothetical protein NDU88_002450 [Pleurodeles waltl]|uniref:Uncharacterized protein n=1 Tax=Pleurodeles waltl TaxID=8319 RepID=A0AAV7QBR2_PLEWA|nr:hypothetical protein NDU88_002450 [Pleurodeles waltl]